MTGLYAIADSEVLAAKAIRPELFAEHLRLAGVKTLQLRNKRDREEEVLLQAQQLSKVFDGSGTLLVMNDRPHAMLSAGWNAVHVGQDDQTPDEVRALVGKGCVIGISTHNVAEVWAAEQGVADYVAVGPVFPSSTKPDAADCVGLEGVRMARERTRKPLVAIGGITLENCRSVVQAGADAIAVISGLFRPGEQIEMVARRFIDLVG